MTILPPICHNMTVLERELKKQRKQEQEMLQGIVAVTSPEFAEQAADVLASKKHSYGFEWYLNSLKQLQRLISAGMPNYLALNAVQTVVNGTTEDIISAWKLANAVFGDIFDNPELLEMDEDD